MLITPQAATTALLLLSSLQSANAASSSSASSSMASSTKYTARHRSEFLAAMNAHPSNTSSSRRRNLQNKKLDMSTFQEALNGNSPRSKRLRSKVLERATPTNDEGKALQAKHVERTLVDNMNKALGVGASHHRKLSNDDDGGADESGSVWNVNFGFDATQYSVSYMRCAEVRQFDDALAAQEDSPDVFTMEHFAIFRFCPAKTCDPSQAYTYGNNAEEEAYNALNGNYNNNGNNNANNNANNANQEVTFNPEDLGARGEGCSSNYGEYMLTITEYLSIMAEYHADRFEAYCEYCEECMYKVYEKWMQSMNAGRKLTSQEKAEEWMRDLEESVNGRNLGYEAACDEYETCQYYKNLCKQGIDDEVENYFECAAAENTYNGIEAYIGPHCSMEDAYTIELGVYADENCNNYVGDYVAAYLGEEYEEDPLQDYYHPQEQVCIPCRASDRQYETLEEQYEELANYEYDPDADVNELCIELYATAARCDKHYRSYNSKNARSKHYTVAQMDRSCDYIDSVVAENFDQYGEVLLDNSTLPFGENSYLQNNLMWNEYGHHITDVKAWQIVMLILSIGACAALAVWSVKLHDSLRKGWKPRSKGGMSATEEALGRNESGIGMTRSTGSGIGMARTGSYYA